MLADAEPEGCEAEFAFAFEFVLVFEAGAEAEFEVEVEAIFEPEPEPEFEVAAEAAFELEPLWVFEPESFEAAALVLVFEPESLSCSFDSLDSSASWCWVDSCLLSSLAEEDSRLLELFDSELDFFSLLELLVLLDFLLEVLLLLVFLLELLDALEDFLSEEALLDTSEEAAELLAPSSWDAQPPRPAAASRASMPARTIETAN